MGNVCQRLRPSKLQLILRLSPEQTPTALTPTQSRDRMGSASASSGTRKNKCSTTMNALPYVSLYNSTMANHAQFAQWEHTPGLTSRLVFPAVINAKHADHTLLVNNATLASRTTSTINVLKYVAMG